ncbi:GntR family transcriptional regulator [Fodinibius salsisoli]|uniref:GntR family transcriptional regulator n=1 Tax=Fodinibius salsisoli TaxID=2820877 RepID=A0ABT3PI18_9BACT|nr:GntR family transcriptional regulator [Fodinibius salsisoli]MCW9705576.1 GntR family transcriptional regulator [Fodinibius salsisoli]
MLKEGIPRHTQISQWLRQQIEDHKFKADEQLPSENELCQKFEVSRVTVRKALQTLENEQLIYRSQGLGSFVNDDRPRQSLIQLTDFEEDMQRAGMEASSSVITFKPVPVVEPIASKLNIDPDSTVVRLDRLRLGDGQPIAFDITWLPMFYGQLIEGYELDKETIYDILERDYEIPVDKGYYRIEAESADAYLANHLQVEEQAALLLIDRLSLTVGEKPVYYQKRYYRSDRIVYELMAERNRDSKGGEGNMPLREFLPVVKK